MASIPQKARILRFAAEQGVVSLKDVARHLQRIDNMPAVCAALHESGLTYCQHGALKKAVWYLSKPESLEFIEYYYPYLPPFEIRPLSFYPIKHTLELNRIRLTLQESDRIKVKQWWSENYIRALFCASGMRSSHGMIPDAVFLRQRADGTNQKFFLEYERTLKDRRRYIRIFRAYAKKEDVKDRNVIYLCQTRRIKQYLERLEARLAKTGELEGAGRYFQFIELEEFYKTYSTNHPKQEGAHEHNQLTKENGSHASELLARNRIAVGV